MMAALKFESSKAESSTLAALPDRIRALHRARFMTGTMG